MFTIRHGDFRDFGTFDEKHRVTEDEDSLAEIMWAECDSRKCVYENRRRVGRFSAVRMNFSRGQTTSSRWKLQRQIKNNKSMKCRLLTFDLATARLLSCPL